MKRNLILSLLFLIILSPLNGQDFLDSLMTEASPEFTESTFKGTRLIGLPTIETQGKGTIEFRVSHRFGDFNSGGYNFWGLDGGATIWLGLDYALTDRFTFGLGRSSFQKFYDGHVKYKWLRQTSDNRMPVTLTLYAGSNYTDLKDPNAILGRNMYVYPVNRLSFVHMVIIARKFNERFSLQITPTHIHYNIVELLDDKNTILALAAAGRYKISKRAAITSEYSRCLNNYRADLSAYSDVFSLGFDLETGGHIFQIYVSNAHALNPAQFIPYTTMRWSNGGGRLGFNISRVF